MIFPTVPPTKSRLPRHSADCMPRIESAFRAVEGVLEDLGIENPAALRSPQVVEEALEGMTPLDGSLVILDAAELRAAELDLEETVADERAGGSLFVSLPNLGELSSRRVRYRDLAAAATSFAFVEPGAHVLGFGRFHFAPRPTFMRRWRVLVADTPGFRVAVISRPLAKGGFIGLWTGNPDLVDGSRASCAASRRAPATRCPRPPSRSPRCSASPTSPTSGGWPRRCAGSARCARTSCARSPARRPCAASSSAASARRRPPTPAPPRPPPPHPPPPDRP
jgi:hypothetical protein